METSMVVEPGVRLNYYKKRVLHVPYKNLTEPYKILILLPLLCLKRRLSVRPFDTGPP